MYIYEIASVVNIIMDLQAWLMPEHICLKKNKFLVGNLHSKHRLPCPTKPHISRSNIMQKKTWSPKGNFKACSAKLFPERISNGMSRQGHTHILRFVALRPGKRIWQGSLFSVCQGRDKGRLSIRACKAILAIVQFQKLEVAYNTFPCWLQLLWDDPNNCVIL